MWSVSHIRGSKKRVIVTISRFIPKKRLDLVASKLSNYEWYLIGSAGLSEFEVSASKQVLRSIMKNLERLGIRNSHVVTNAPRSKLKELLMMDTFYVHPMFPEHFGISVAEAISAGCIPAVYKDGGRGPI